MVTNQMPPRSIDLTPTDYLWVTYQERTPLPRSEPRSFDQQDAVTRLNKARNRYNTGWDWSKVRIPDTISPQEAHFWFEAMTCMSPVQRNSISLRDEDKTVTKLTTALAKQAYSGDIGLDEVRARLIRSSTLIGSDIMRVLGNLVPVEEIIDLLQYQDLVSLNKIIEASSYDARYAAGARQRLLNTLADGFLAYVWPYLTQAEVDSLRRRLYPTLKRVGYEDEPRFGLPLPVWRLAASLGMHEEVLGKVRNWPNGYGDYWCHRYYARAQQVVFGLGTAQEVESEMRRLALPLTTPTHIRVWVAHTQYSALDYARDNILAAAKKHEAKRMLEAFARVHAPEVVRPMVTLLASSKAPEVARRWLEEHPEYATAQLIPFAASADAQTSVARQMLLRVKDKGHDALIDTHISQLPLKDAERLRRLLEGAAETSGLTVFDEETTPLWLQENLPPRISTRASWPDPALLPPIHVDQYRLNARQIAGLLQILRKGRLNQLDHPPHPLVAHLRTQADQATVDAFVWQLFKLWLEEDMSSKYGWAMVAVGLLGGEASAYKLAQITNIPLIKGRHRRTELVRKCLKAICGDLSLMPLESLARRARLKSLQPRIQQVIEAIAKAHGMTREQLEDRFVPDCGLDERGTRVFDFGPRQFTFCLSHDLKPRVRNGAGKLRANLPKPGVKDDSELARQAIAEWKQTRKQVRDVLKAQVARLQEAMVTGRRWTTCDFEIALVRHPVLVSLVRPLLWGVYGETGSLKTTFRVTEDNTYADAKDETFELAGAETVGIVHPIHLTQAEKSAWGEMFSDYELVPPFPQLGREVYRLEENELTAKEITRFRNAKVAGVSLVSTFESAHWMRGPIEDGACFSKHSKSFESSGVTAIVTHSGIQAFDIVHSGVQNIERCYFVPGACSPKAYSVDEDRLTLGEVDPVVISEVLRDLTTVASKAKSE